jgi:O-antigen biosynthesis protein
MNVRHEGALPGPDQPSRQIPRPTALTRSVVAPPATSRLSPYYEFPREDLLTLVPRAAVRILDVGCASGALGRGLKRQDPSRTIYGIEACAPAAQVATTNLDFVLCADAHAAMCELANDNQRFDAVIFADVLEHLVDPWAVLRLARQLLNDSGCIVSSIPNVCIAGITRALLFHGRWDYVDAGILDRTHLRFFTKSTIRQTFAETGFSIVHMRRNYIDMTWKDNVFAVLVSLLSRNKVSFDDLHTYQYLVVAAKNSVG